MNSNNDNNGRTKVLALVNEQVGAKKPKKGRKVSKDVEDILNDAKQAAFLQTTKEEIKSQQLSLFDFAPWPNYMRALPNDYARSALFTVRNKRQAREALQQKPIYHVNKDVSITYTGIELRADDDEIIWQQVLEYSKRTPIGNAITFTFFELCKDVGWSINGRYYKKAEECLTRLQASAMQFFSPRIGRLESISLIDKFTVLDRGKRTSRCQVKIDENMVMLFAGEHYTRFVWDIYRELSPIARRLFDYFASHKEPYPLKLESFRLMCGSDSTRLKKWKEQTAAACNELMESGLVQDAWVIKDEVRCKRNNRTPVPARED